mmetsp:Transcript_1356/g.5542  ORF Transcript_1356/g.5542 Transcript_1356/m.5542 type:complete len:249 (+) Transcript_1356:61-807(+)
MGTCFTMSSCARASLSIVLIASFMSDFCVFISPSSAVTAFAIPFRLARSSRTSPASLPRASPPATTSAAVSSTFGTTPWRSSLMSRTRASVATASVESRPTQSTTSLRCVPAHSLQCASTVPAVTSCWHPSSLYGQTAGFMSHSVAMCSLSAARLTSAPHPWGHLSSLWGHDASCAPAELAPTTCAHPRFWHSTGRNAQTSLCAKSSSGLAKASSQCASPRLSYAKRRVRAALLTSAAAQPSPRATSA